MCDSTKKLINNGDDWYIFLVMDLVMASPATVSRCGMIYMEPSKLGWKTFTQSWIDKCQSQWIRGNEALIMGLVKWSLPPVIYS